MRADTNTVGFRLRSARGHLGGVIRMVDEDSCSIDVLHQLSAVQGALNQVRRDILEAHIRECVPEAIAEGRVDGVVDELLAAFFGTAPGSRSQHHCQHTDVTPSVAPAGT